MAATAPSADNDALARGNAALLAMAWDEALACFEESLRVEESAEAYEGLSWSALWLHDEERLFRAREAAFRLYRQRRDNLGAARMAIWLSGDYVDLRGELSIAQGWRERARRLLEETPPAAEHGWLAIVEGDAALCYETDTRTALTCASRALAIGREIDSPEIEMLALAMEGLCLVTEGQVEDGMKRLDEASASALGGECQDPMAISWALCYLIYACERVRDINRAQQWCDRLREYADRFQISQAQGICRLHYAGVLIWRGQWAEAETELSEATEAVQFSRLLVAEGVVRLADLRRRQGRVEEAEALFRQAEWHPLAMLGMAELALDGARPKDAQELIERALRQVAEPARTVRAAAYELQARVEALIGNRARAAEAVEALTSVSDAVATTPLQAAAHYCAAQVAIANRDFDGARTELEDAVSLYERSSAPYESARARLDLASVLVALGRDDRARGEAEAALAALERLGSRLYAQRAAALVRDLDSKSAVAVNGGSGLTERQVEILQLISRGLNDRDVAAALVVSEHTVHRHVANILQRLALPSRAAAVAYASANKLI